MSRANPNRHARLTSRAWSLLAGSAAMGLAGKLFGIEELLPLAVAGAALVTFALAWSLQTRWSLDVTRQVHPARVAAGQDAWVDLTVVNPGRLRTPPVAAGDPFDGGTRWARFAIAPVAPGIRRRASYRLPTSRRGVFRLGPLELKAADPFGLVERTRTGAHTAFLTIHPRVEELSVGALASRREGDRSRHAVIGAEGSELFALRAYVPGDDLRHVHWPSTARLDDLVIRQPESLGRGRVTVFGDLRDAVHEGETLEVMLSAVASLAISALHAGLQVRVATTGGFDSGPGWGHNHAAAILDGLAAAETHAARSTGRIAPSGGSLHFAGPAEPTVVVTTDRAGADDIEAACGLGGVDGTTLVVFETVGGAATGVAKSRPPDGTRRARFVRVAVGGSFRTAWEAM